MSTAITGLFRSRKFLLSLVAVIQTVVFSLIPEFPEEVWQAINVILLFLVGAIALEDASLKFGAARAMPGLLLPPGEGEFSPANPVTSLFRSRKFLLTLVAVLQTAVFSVLPNFPQEVWQAINVILVFLIGAIAVEDAALQLGAARENPSLLR